MLVRVSVSVAMEVLTKVLTLPRQVGSALSRQRHRCGNRPRGARLLFQDKMDGHFLFLSPGILSTFSSSTPQPLSP
jgi:hypothetical protein